LPFRLIEDRQEIPFAAKKNTTANDETKTKEDKQRFISKAATL